MISKDTNNLFILGPLFLCLKRHKESVHDGVRYSCDSCEYKATTLSHLKTHKEAIHDGVRYSCDSCNYKATTLNSIKTHRESIHDGVRYSCDSCDYKATKLSHLKTHKNQFFMVSDILVIVVNKGPQH